MQEKIIIIVDNRETFYSTVGSQRTLCTMNVKKIIDNFSRFGFNVHVLRFAEIDFDSDWVGVPVIYTSSEDVGLLYKGFIEDVILGLEIAGAILLPSYQYLRAHHNKLMMEILRYSLFPDEAKQFDTRCFGTYEELDACHFSPQWPKVIKSAFGAGAKQVAVANNLNKLKIIARKFSRSISIGDVFREYRSRLLWRGYINRSLHRNKFIVQNLIPNLDGDFKVLRYGKRYYTLSRRNRKGDFRASGSGNFSFETPDYVDESALLEYSKKIADRIGTPLCSLDVAFDGKDFRLIEFQCLNFGTLTAEKSEHHHIFTGGHWEKVVVPCDLEQVFTDAIVEHLTSIVGSAI